MSRTTLDIDDVVLRELKRIQSKDGRSLGRLVSDLLSRSLSERQVETVTKPLKWHVSKGGALVDILDKDAVESALAESADKR